MYWLGDLIKKLIWSHWTQLKVLSRALQFTINFAKHFSCLRFWKFLRCKECQHFFHYLICKWMFVIFPLNWNVMVKFERFRKFCNWYLKICSYHFEGKTLDTLCGKFCSFYVALNAPNVFVLLKLSLRSYLETSCTSQTSFLF
jgi:hypothetical protein